MVVEKGQRGKEEMQCSTVSSRGGLGKEMKTDRQMGRFEWSAGGEGAMRRGQRGVKGKIYSC